MRGAPWLWALAPLAALGCDAKPAASDAGATAAAQASAPSAPLTASAAVSQQQLDAEVQTHLSELRRDCYQPFLKKGGEPPGAPLPLMLEIGPDGRVVDAAAAGGGAELRKLRSCIEQAARRWRLPAPGKRSELAVTLEL